MRIRKWNSIGRGTSVQAVMTVLPDGGAFILAVTAFANDSVSEADGVVIPLVDQKLHGRSTLADHESNEEVVCGAFSSREVHRYLEINKSRLIPVPRLMGNGDRRRSKCGAGWPCRLL